MRAGGVATLCSHCRVIAYQPQAAENQLKQVATALLQYTPEVSISGPNTISLHLSASLYLFGGPRALYRKIHAQLKRSQYHVKLAMAPTATGSLLLLHTPERQRRALSFKRLLHLMGPIACTHLHHAQPHLKWLTAIGCTTLSELYALPREALLRRTSALLLDELDQAYGQQTESLAFFQPEPVFDAKLELYDAVEQVNVLWLRAQRLIEQLCGWLHAYQLAVNQLVLHLEHERRRHHLEPSQLILSFGSPTWCPQRIAQLLREHLNHYELPAGVIALQLSASDLQSRQPDSLTLFPDPHRSANELPPLFDLLKARLGTNAIQQAAPIADYRPEHANHWQTHHSPSTPSSRSPAPLAVTTRPFWLMPSPLLLSIKNHRPFYTSALRLLSGPERIEDGWWDAQAIARDYFIAEAEDGSRYWIYQDLKEGGQWYLHGLFA